MKSRSVKKSSYQEVMDQINHASKINAEAAARAAEEKAAKEEAESKLNSIYGYTNLASSPNRPKLKRKLEGDDDGDDFEYDEEDDDDDEEEEDVTVIDPPMKRQKVATLGEPWQSSTPAKSNSSNHTSGAANLAASISENKINAVVTTTPKTTSTPRFVIDSPNRPILAGKNLTYTSSFSCSSNFELSPVRPLETGPLLEPLDTCKQHLPKFPKSTTTTTAAAYVASGTYTKSRPSQKHQLETFVPRKPVRLSKNFGILLHI